MSHITRITAVGLLMGALTSGLVQAFPLISEAPLSQQTGASSFVDLAMGWLAPLFAGRHDHVKSKRHGHQRGSATGQEKEGSQMDPNGLH